MRPARLLLVLIGSSCASNGGGSGSAAGATTAADCIAEYDSAKGYGWDDDLAVLVAPPAGGEGAAEPPAQVDTAVQDCLRDLGGQDPEACDRARVMTREAALCITRSQQFAEGTAPWKAGITYHYGERRIVWNVQNLLEDDGHGAQRGEYLRLDALHGALLGSGAWGATP